MSLSLINTPVTPTDNVLAGFLPQLLEFKREDITVIDVTQGANNTILVRVTGDITSDIAAGESVYLYSQGLTSDYDGSGVVISAVFAAGQTTLNIDIQFVEIANGGYINYLQEWFVEVALVDVNNTDKSILTYTLRDDGTPAGVANIDISAANDLNEQFFPLVGGVGVENRTKFTAKYRQSWRGNNEQAYTLTNEEYIVQFSTEELENDTIVNDFETPILYVGYPAAIALIHSDLNFTDKVVLRIDELDINKADIITDTQIRQYAPGAFGYLYGGSEDVEIELNQNTEYLRIKYASEPLADYKAGDYKAGDYKTT